MLFPPAPLLRTFRIAFLAVLLPAASYAEPPERNKVSAEAVPGLTAYMQKNYQDKPTYQVWAVDLDVPSDGVDEVILHIDDFNYCGSGGCEWTILRREPEGSLMVIAGMLAGDLTLKPADGAPRLQVVAATRHGNKPMDITGKTSGQLQKMHRQSPVSRSGKRVIGPCKAGFLWSGEASGNRGVARYETCVRDVALVRFECQKDIGAIKVTFPIDRNSFEDGEVLASLFSVIRKQQTRFFPHPGKLAVSQRDSPMVSVLFDRYDGFLDALKQGDRAMFNASTTKLDLHLKGSSKAIAAMLAGCPDGRLY